MKRMASAVVSAQKLQLALNGDWQYADYLEYELDVDNIVSLLEEANDELKPRLEALIRRPVK